MTSSKLSALTDITTLAGTDIFYAVRPGTPDADYKATMTGILAYTAASLATVTLNQTGLAVKGASSNALTIKPNETLSAARILNLIVNNADRTISLSGNLTVSADATISGTNTGDQTLSSLGLAASSTDNTLVRFDSTAGHTQTSGIVVSDNDEISGFRALVVTDAGTARTLAATDTGTTIRFTAGTAVTVTLPDSMISGFTVEIIQGGAGQVSFSAGGGATINNRSSQTKTAGQYGAVRLVVVANSGGSAAVYNLAGDTGA